MLNVIIVGGLIMAAFGAALVAWEFLAGFIAGARAEWRGTTIADALVSRATPRGGLGQCLISAGGMVALIAWLARAVFT